jgi:hypothetical protein
MRDQQKGKEGKSPLSVNLHNNICEEKKTSGSFFFAHEVGNSSSTKTP